jgi:hypothetical protein
MNKRKTYTSQFKREAVRLMKRAESGVKRCEAVEKRSPLEENLVEKFIADSFRFKFPFQPFGETYAGKGRRVGCALARQLAQHGLHGRCRRILSCVVLSWKIASRRTSSGSL